MSHFSKIIRKPFALTATLSLTAVLALSGCLGSDDGDNGGTPPPAAVDWTRQQLLDSGEVFFAGTCSGCHGSEGEGSRGPQVAYSDYVMGDKFRLAQTVLEGLPSNGDTIVVNGVKYAQGGMPAHSYLRDEEVAGIVTYLRVVFNDSLMTNCVVSPDGGSSTCTKVARTAEDIASDSISVAFVASVRDSLGLDANQ
jgi:mono/diheme cytochrome c family protein